MKRLISALLLLACAWLILGACSGGSGSTHEPGTPAVIENYRGLAEYLRGSGITVMAGGTVEQPFLSIKGKSLLANDHTIDVFEYKDAPQAEAEAKRIALDGRTAKVQQNGGMRAINLQWLETPHFYRHGRLLVISLGDDATVKAALIGALGQQFAGG